MAIRVLTYQLLILITGKYFQPIYVYIADNFQNSRLAAIIDVGQLLRPTWPTVSARRQAWIPSHASQ